MFFMEPNSTPYDLRWTMFGIPVRVHPMFWLVSVIMGVDLLRAGIQYLLIWVGCMFVSILIHELGHVCMGLAFGSRGHIVLYGFGGLAIGSNHLGRRWQRVAVSCAGPAAGFVFLGVLFVFLWVWDPQAFLVYVDMVIGYLGLPIDNLADFHLVGPRLNHMALFIVGNLIFINLLWGLVNLLPVWPLDGGMICREVCEGISPARGLWSSLGISLVVAGLLSLHCILVRFGHQLLPLPIGSVYAAILFGILAFQSYQLLQQVNTRQQWMDDRWDDRD